LINLFWRLLRREEKVTKKREEKEKSIKVQLGGQKSPSERRLSLGGGAGGYRPGGRKGQILKKTEKQGNAKKADEIAVALSKKRNLPSRKEEKTKLKKKRGVFAAEKRRLEVKWL